MPHYLVTTQINGDKPIARERIVQAKNEAAALRHVVSDTITVTRATVDDGMRLAATGIKAEIAEEA